MDNFTAFNSAFECINVGMFRACYNMNVLFLAGESGFNTWEQIYSGNDTFYEDKGLTMYTIYQYRVTTFNRYGHNISQPSDRVATFGGKPLRPPVVMVTAVDYASVFVEWITPSKIYSSHYISQFIKKLLRRNCLARMYTGNTVNQFNLVAIKFSVLKVLNIRQ